MRFDDGNAAASFGPSHTGRPDVRMALMKSSRMRRCGVASPTSGEAALTAAPEPVAATGGGKRGVGLLQIDPAQTGRAPASRCRSSRSARRGARNPERPPWTPRNTPSAPFLNCSVATTVSSTSILCSCVPARASTLAMGPKTCSIRSTRVYRLVDEGAAAVERERAAPARPAVVFRWPIPLARARTRESDAQARRRRSSP